MSTGGRYDVVTTRDSVFQEEAFILRDRSTGSSALVIPGLGNNLMSFIASLAEDGTFDIIMGAPMGTTKDNAWRWGNPILFPFPNRVRNARYAFDGRQHQFDANIPEGHRLHGLVCFLPWRVDEAGSSSDGATIRCSIRAEDHPGILRQYPFPFVLTVAYTLSGTLLRCQADVQNVGSGPMPMGFGLHPYFRAPLEAGGNREDCLISVPASMAWQLDADKLPTGRKDPVPTGLDFRTPRPLDGIYLDDCYTNLDRRADQVICRLIDPYSNVEVVEQFGPEFPELVVLAPADRAIVSFEPYTCVTDAINLASQRPDSGLIILKPGDRWQGNVWFTVRHERRPMAEPQEGAQ